MKKINWIYLIIVIALVASCGKAGENNKPDSIGVVPTPVPLAIDSTKTVISLAQLVLDTLIGGNTLLEETKSGNLKKLWKFDEELYLASSRSQKFIVTREINPCCPCSTVEPSCCQCLIETELAAVSDMGATATLDGTSILTTTVDEVDYFKIPTGTTGAHDLKI